LLIVELNREGNVIVAVLLLAVALSQKSNEITKLDAEPMHPFTTHIHSPNLHLH
jgi:hypothetical protein